MSSAKSDAGDGATLFLWVYAKLHRSVYCEIVG